MDNVAWCLRCERGVALVGPRLRDLAEDLRERREADERLAVLQTERLLRRLLRRGSVFTRRCLHASAHRDSTPVAAASPFCVSRVLRRLPMARITLLAASSSCSRVGAGLEAGRSLPAPATNLPINHASRWRALSCISKWVAARAAILR